MKKFRIGLTVVLLLGVAGPGLAGFAGTQVYLPAVGLGPGYQGSHWHTSVWIENPGSVEAKVTVQFLARGSSNPSAPTANLVVPPGETLHLRDVLADLFAMTKGYGALRFVSDQKVLVASRAFSQPPDAGEENSTGMFFGAVPAAFAIGQGDMTSTVGASQLTPMDTGPFRYNFGFVETTGNNVTVRVTAYNGDDPTVALGSKDYAVGGFAAVQENLSKLIANPNGDNILLRFEVLSGPGRIIAFGTGIANGSNDPSAFEMLFADSLLGGGGGGLQAVSHDTTLSGDGTASSPLGVADGAITAAKLSASGSAAGQVLTSDGTSVHWQTLSGGGGGGLTLPYSGEASSDSPAFVVRNTGNGRAIYADSQSHDGVMGVTHVAVRSGVYGSSTDSGGYGVFGRNTANAATGFLGGSDSSYNGGVNVSVGAFGRADGSNGQTGVMGVSSGGTGVAGMELSSGSYGTLGTAGVGVFGDTGNLGSSSTDRYAIWGYNSAPGGYAGNFSGDVAISGSLFVQGSKNFRIDHPLDPARKYLDHAAVESDEVLDQYTGNVILDGEGRATVELPEWFESINTKFRYQLTAIGAAAPNLHVAREIQDHRFEIAGGPPGLKVSWMVIARRNDPYLRDHPFTPEPVKEKRLRGYYLYPQGFGQPGERSIEWASHPRVMRALASKKTAREMY